MFIVEKNSMKLMLPISDEEIRQLYHENWQTLFLPVKSAHCLCARIDNFDFRTNIPAKVQVQEMNLLAWLLEQLDQRQRSIFSAKINNSKMCPGEMINLALLLFPEAVGGKRRGEAVPQYTGENLYDLMTYKRFQDWKRLYPEFQIIKILVPVHVKINRNDDSGLIRVGEADAAAYQSLLSDMLTRRMRPYDTWRDWESYSFYLTSFEYEKLGILFDRPEVEVCNGRMQGIIVLGARHVLSEQEIEQLKARLNNKISDMWNEHLPPVALQEGKIYLTFTECAEVYQQRNGELELTEQEMFQLQAPYYAERVWNNTGFTPDFREDWEFMRTRTVWLELTNNRKTIRIPLPAEGESIQGAQRCIGADQEEQCLIKIKAPAYVFFREYRLDKMNLSLLNRLAEEIQKMEPEAEEEFLSTIEECGYPEEDLEFICRILEQIRINKEQVVSTGQMGLKI